MSNVEKKIEELRTAISEALAADMIGYPVTQERLNEHAKYVIERFNGLSLGDRIRFYATLTGKDPEKAVVEIADVHASEVEFESAADVSIVFGIVLNRPVRTVHVNFSLSSGKYGSTPCPAQDGCALNRGARHCFHCRRDWPPDASWDLPLQERPIMSGDRACPECGGYLVFTGMGTRSVPGEPEAVHATVFRCESCGHSRVTPQFAGDES